MLGIVMVLVGVAVVRGGEPATQPTTQPVTVIPVANDMPRHEHNLQRIQHGPIGVMFMGDSITWGWGHHPELWDKTFGRYNPANFGIPGDRTQNVLWRINHGELDGYQARVIVLMIGTNNTGDPPRDIILGVREIVRIMHQKQPRAMILLMAALPRQHEPGKTRHEVEQFNAELSKLSDDPMVRYVDIGRHFVGEDGMISKEMMYDYLHLTEKGYQIWAQKMGPILQQMMQMEDK
jgi:lysophospholipase L1-like esterase